MAFAFQAAIERNATVSPLTANDKEEMLNRHNKVQPGYYEVETYQLGTFWHMAATNW